MPSYNETVRPGERIKISLVIGGQTVVITRRGGDRFKIEVPEGLPVEVERHREDGGRHNERAGQQ